jgi:hypothetical protein
MASVGACIHKLWLAEKEIHGKIPEHPTILAHRNYDTMTQEIKGNSCHFMHKHWWKKGLQSRFVKAINPGFRNRD